MDTKPGKPTTRRTTTSPRQTHGTVTITQKQTPPADGQAPSGLSREVDRVAAVLPTGTIADAVGATARTVRGWRSGTTVPSSTYARRIAALGETVDRLSRVINPDYIQVWLLKPVAYLDDRTPADVLADGDPHPVLQLVSNLESPGAA